MRRAILATLAALVLVLPTYASAHEGDNSDPHQNETGQGHDGHKGYGWGHHCRKKKLVCKCYKHKKNCRYVWTLAPCPDAGTQNPDSGTPSEPDAGTPNEPDAGTPSEPDAGTPGEPDAGTPSQDSSTPPQQDAGIPQEPDLGTQEPDAGGQTPDLGTQEPDADTPSRDSGEPTRDAGVPPQRDSGEPKQDGGDQPGPDAGQPNRDGTVTAILDGGRTTIPPVFNPFDGGTEPPCSCDDTELAGGGCSMTNAAGSGLGLVLLLVGLFFLARRRKGAAGILALAFLFAVPGMARADGLSLSVPGLSPAASPYSYYRVDSARMLKQGGFSTQVLLNYGRNPLTLRRASDGERLNNVIKGRLDMDLLMAVGLFNRIELGFGLPITLAQQDGNLGALQRTDTLEAGIGDLRFTPKVLIAANEHLALSVLGTVTLPSARKSQLLGSGGKGVTFTPTLLTTLNTAYFDASINIGARIRDGKTVSYNAQTIKEDGEIVGGLGFRVPLARHRLDLIGDLSFAVSMTEQDPEEKSFEALGGLRAYLPYGFTVNAGGGAGLARGIGTPDWRVLGGIGWTFEPAPPAPCPKPRTIVKIRRIPVVRYVKYPVVKKVTVVKNTIFLPPVYFATDKDTVLPQSLATLDTVVKMLKENKWVEKVMVEGHADYRASDAYNLDLSRRRARSVYRYLVANGIDTSRLDQVGYGERRPVAPGKDKKSLAKNRRVEFVVVNPKQP